MSKCYAKLYVHRPVSYHYYLAIYLVAIIFFMYMLFEKFSSIIWYKYSSKSKVNNTETLFEPLKE